MFLLHMVHTSAARTEPSACLNKLQRIMRPQHTGTHTVEVSAAMSLLAKPRLRRIIHRKVRRVVRVARGTRGLRAGRSEPNELWVAHPLSPSVVKSDLPGCPTSRRCCEKWDSL